jgi:molybdate transport system substrate-binding protein
MTPIPREILSTKPQHNGVYKRPNGTTAPRCLRRPPAALRACLPVLTVLLGIVPGGCDNGADATREVVQIDAAASIAHVIEQMSDEIQHDLDLTILVNANSTGILAQQINRGDRVDIFISADDLWMDRLNQQGLIDPDTRVDLATNRLVVVGLADSALHPESLENLSDNQYQPIAIGDPAYVPAGRYAMQAFQSQGLTPTDNLNLAQAPNVRSAVAFVQAGQCPVGLVYLSDARASNEIKILLTIDPADHDPIRYPAAILKNTPHPEQAQRVLNWLQGKLAQSAFAAAGFSPPQ